MGAAYSSPASSKTTTCSVSRLSSSVSVGSLVVEANDFSVTEEEDSSESALESSSLAELSASGDGTASSLEVLVVSASVVSGSLVSGSLVVSSTGGVDSGTLSFLD